jgi:hypothetical protein
MPRVEFEGALYHLLCRGDRREALPRPDPGPNLYNYDYDGRNRLITATYPPDSGGRPIQDLAIT